MTVAALAAEIAYLEDGVTLAFAAPFRFLDASHLEVTRVAADGGVTTLAQGTDWSASGGSTDAGGTVTLISSTSGATLRIRRVTPRSQQADYTTGDAFPAESHEAALDKTVLIDQEQDVRIDAISTRALRVPDGETSNEVPALADRASRLLGFDGLGNPEAGPLTALVQALVTSGLSSLTIEGAGVVGTTAAMTALLKSTLTDGDALHVLGRNAALDGGGGPFRWDAASAATADGGNVFAADEGGAGRWVRQQVLADVLAKEFGSPGDGLTEEAAEVQAAMDEAGSSGRPLRLLGETMLIGAQLDIPQGGVQIEGGGTATIKGDGTAFQHIRAENLTGKMMLRDLIVDANAGGELNAGVIQIAGTGGDIADLVNVTVKNGTNVSGASGVDGIAAAGYDYGGAGEKKARVRVIGGHVNATSKAAYNITTLTEYFWIVGAMAEAQSGNGTTPGFQINGAKSGLLIGDIAYSSEGANFYVGTNTGLGGSPGYEESLDITFLGCLGADAGRIGATFTQGFGFYFTNSGGAGVTTWSNIRRFACKTINPYWGAGLISTMRGVHFSGEFSRDTTGGITVQNCADITGDYHALDVNSRGTTYPAALDLRGSDRVAMQVRYDNLTDATAPFLIYASTSASDDCDIEAEWTGDIRLDNPLTEEVEGYFSGRMRFAHRYDVALGVTQKIQAMFCSAGRTAILKVTARAIAANGDACQQEVRWTIKGGAPCTKTENFLVDAKDAGFATGIKVDLSSNNVFEVQFVGHTGQASELWIDFDMVI